MQLHERLDKAISFYEKGNFSEAIVTLEPLLVCNNLEAISLISDIYLVSEKYGKAFEYAVRAHALDEKNILANTNLGLIYYLGLNVGNDDAKAFKYFKAAADQGDILCSARVGYMLTNGEGVVDTDQKLARKYYKFAGEHGHTLSNFLICRTYFREMKITKGLYYFFRYILPLKLAQYRNQLEKITLF